MSKAISTLPVGAKVKHPGTTYYGAPIVWDVMEHGHDGTGTTSLVTDKIICLKAFDAKEPANTDANRKNYGNNNYKLSNLLQWLNSTAGPGTWYAAQHTTDQAPASTTYVSHNPYSDEAGFLYGFASEFRDILQSKPHTTVKNTVTDSGGSESVTSKIFLLSTTEVGLANENSIAEGSLYALFAQAENRKAKPTAQAVTNSTYQTSTFNADAFWWYWLRTPYSASSYSVRIVYTDGSLNNDGACGGSLGVRPACVIPSTTLVSDSPDSDGAYIIMFNEAPVIHTTPQLGDKNHGFDVIFSVTDADNDTTKAEVTLETGSQSISLMDETPIVLGNQYTVTVSTAQLQALEVGTAYTIKIKATDSSQNAATQNVTFTRTASTVLISDADRDLGVKWLTFTTPYTVTDTVPDTTLTVTESVDEIELRTFNPASGATQAVSLQGVWALLQNEDEHTIRITASNSEGATAIRQWTFTKLGDRLQFATKPILTDLAAKTLLVALQTEATGPQTVQIEATNNAAAPNPVWEDCTEAVLAGKTYAFTNKPLEHYGVAVRVTQTKGADCERVYCNAIGLSFR